MASPDHHQTRGLGSTAGAGAAGGSPAPPRSRPAPTDAAGDGPALALLSVLAVCYRWTVGLLLGTTWSALQVAAGHIRRPRGA